MRTNRRNWKIFTIQSCRKPTKAVIKEEAADSSSAKAKNKARLDQVLMKSIEELDN
jgi:hypothetical protein